jgi:hypothetical protein
MDACGRWERKGIMPKGKVLVGDGKEAAEPAGSIDGGGHKNGHVNAISKREVSGSQAG